MKRKHLCVPRRPEQTVIYADWPDPNNEPCTIDYFLSWQRLEGNSAEVADEHGGVTAAKEEGADRRGLSESVEVNFTLHADGSSHSEQSPL